MKRLSEIGFKNGNTVFDYPSLSAAQKRGLVKASQFGLYLIDANAATMVETVHGWRWPPKSGIRRADDLSRTAWGKWHPDGGTDPISGN